MKKDIIIKNISLNSLATQINFIKQEANQIISNNIQEAIKLIKKSVELTDSNNYKRSKRKFSSFSIHDSEKKTLKEEIKNNLLKAKELLEDSVFIGSVTGIEVIVPYTSSYSGYYDNDTMSLMIANSESELLEEVLEEESLSDLVDLLQGLEYQNKQWNSSNC